MLYVFYIFRITLISSFGLIFQYSIGSPYSNAHFGQGSGKVWFENIQCEGSEISLSYCKHLKLGHNNCTHNMDVGVVCGKWIEPFLSFLVILVFFV